MAKCTLYAPKNIGRGTSQFPPAFLVSPEDHETQFVKADLNHRDGRQGLRFDDIGSDSQHSWGDSDYNLIADSDNWLFEISSMGLWQVPIISTLKSKL
jgi:hypothetical protein